MKNVAVIGGAGHVGLPFSIVVANTGKFTVTAIDLDAEKCRRLNEGEMIYREEKGEEEKEEGEEQEEEEESSSSPSENDDDFFANKGSGDGDTPSDIRSLLHQLSTASF